MSEANYFNDYRVRASDRIWYQSVDRKKMTAVLLLDEEEHTVPIKFEVCPTCHGKGTHVNPSVDCNGLTREDFDEDPDFLDSYMSGMYDVSCYECKGERVVPVRDDERIEPKLLQRIKEQEEELYEFRQLQASERRMGA